MIGGNDVEAVVEQCLPEGIAVMRGLYRRVTLDLIAEPFVIIGRKMEVMHAYFRRDSFLHQWNIITE